jgi:hypothetical protein
VASYFVGQRAEGDMADLHRRLDRIEALLTASQADREPDSTSLSKL